jgi:hypothetical protein
VAERDEAQLTEPEIAAQLVKVTLQVALLLREPGSGLGGLSPGADAGPASGAEPAAIRLARELRRLADAALRITVDRVRVAGHTWQEIGDALGTTRQAAFQRFGRPIDPRTGEPVSQALLPDAANRATAIISDWAEGRYDDMTASFDATIAERLPPEKLAAAWAQVVGMAGTFRRMGEPFVRQQGDFTVVDIPLEFEASEMKGRVAFNADGQVGGLFILNVDVP